MQNIEPRKCCWQVFELQPRCAGDVAGVLANNTPCSSFIRNPNPEGCSRCSSCSRAVRATWRARPNALQQHRGRNPNPKRCWQVFELQPRYAGDVAGAAAALVGNLADVHEALSGAAQRAAKAPNATLATGLAGVLPATEKPCLC